MLVYIRSRLLIISGWHVFFFADDVAISSPSCVSLRVSLAPEMQCAPG